ncbi:MAG TPA: hypothetical protein VN577_17550 [Terriglobales bacterium]|nr:hypothetical protein [Terriglobales bacterium]
MGIKDVLNRAGIQGRDAARKGLEKVNDLLHSPTSVEDRVVCNPEGDEHEPQKPRTKPIVSVNGKDIDRTDVNENERAA